MAFKNGYFQVCVKEDGTYLHIFAGQESGRLVEVSEVADYLSFKGISFDLVQVNKAIIANKDITIKLNEEKPYIEQEMMKVTLQDGGMTAVARFYAPFEGGQVMNEDEIINDLKFKKIVYGLHNDRIAAFVNKREYCTDIVVATGKPVREGHDGRIDYLFNTDLNQKPKQNEDGSVDFFNLDTICHCKAGQQLARIFKADSGDVGMNVIGEQLKPREVKKVYFQYGRNIKVSEDGLELYSEIDGHVSLVDDKVFVSGILELPNVDTSTGNIQYEGNVLVTGNITSGFSVKASGDIEVRGVVEGAVVEAGGQIVIARGINGMGRGSLKAGSNIVVRFIENAHVHAGGYVEADSILHSTVTAKTQIIVQGKRGFITGGVVRAGNLIEAKTLGTNMGVDTVLEVGTDPQLKERFNFLQKEIADVRKAITMTEPVIQAVGQRLAKGEKLPAEQMQKMKLLSQNLIHQKELLKNDMMELEELNLMFDQDTTACIRVMGEAFAGTHLIISEASMVLKNTYHYCRFIKEKGDVVMTAL